MGSAGLKLSEVVSTVAVASPTDIDRDTSDRPPPMSGRP